jgi:polysaccharide biosynthesis protein PslH
MSELSKEQRVLYFCSRLPGAVQSGLDLRVQSQILSLLPSCKVSVFGLNGNGKKFDERIHSWQSSTDPTVSQQIDAEAGIKALSFGGHPFAARYSEQTASELRNEILNFKPNHIILSRIDLTVYLNDIMEIFSGQLVLDLDESVESTGPSILNVMNHPGQGLVFKTFCRRVKQAEEDSIRKVDQVWVSSDVEKARVMSTFDLVSSKISTVPNSVLVEAYAPIEGSPEHANTLIYPASFAYEPSVHAARFLINELMPMLPELELKFVGSHIPRWMEEAATGNISVEGPVANIVPYLQASSALVVPLKAGGGTRLKVIEALASGLPIVSTAFGVEGLGLIKGVDYLEAETPQEFAEQCRELVSNSQLAQELSQRGILTAKRNFSINSLEKLTSGLITSGRH